MFKMVTSFTVFFVVVTSTALGADASMMQDTAIQTNLNYVWTILAAVLVFFMQAGFALLETGFTRSKNAVNIIMKNFMDIAAGGLVFFAVGFVTRLCFGPRYIHPLAILDRREWMGPVAPEISVAPVAGFLRRTQRGIAVRFI